MKWLIGWLWLALTPALAAGQQLQLPLQGYYHPGRAMPVRWENLPAGQSLRLASVDSVATQLDAPGSRGIFPWLLWGDGHDTSLGPRLHPLDDPQRLVATTLSDESPSRSLFPDAATFVVHLDPAQPIEGPGMAWETLDGLVVDSQSWARVPESTRRQLLLVGVTLAVADRHRPGGELPWQKNGDLWQVSSGLALPGLIEPEIFDPMLGWPAGRSRAFRTNMIGSAAVVGTIIFALAFWRWRWMPGVAVIAGVASMIAIGGWADRQSPVARHWGSVQLSGDAQPVEDSWLYQVSHRSATFAIPVNGLIQPVGLELGQLRQSSLCLHCDGSGQPVQVTGRLRADVPLALLSRRYATPGSPAQPATSPMRLLAGQSIYRSFQAIGQLRDGEADGDWPRWPTVVLRRSGS